MTVMTFPKSVKGADQSFSPWQIKNLKAAFSFCYSSLISRGEPLDQLVKWLGGNHASKQLGEVTQLRSNEGLFMAK